MSLAEQPAQPAAPSSLNTTEAAHNLNAAKSRTEQRNFLLKTALRGPMLFGLIFGSILTIGGAFMTESVVAILLRDFGGAFLVAAFAVYGYELIDHVSNIITLRTQLQGLGGTLDNVSEQLNRTLQELDENRRWESRDSFERHIHSTIKSPALAKSLTALVDCSLKLELSCPDESSQSYVSLLSWLINQTIGTNAQGLSMFRAAKERPTDGEDLPFAFRIPDTRVIAARILGAQLKILSTDDHYDSISNVLFYDEGRMDYFKTELVQAIGRGVKIRRIFNLSNFETDASLSHGRFKEAKQIVDSHMDLAESHPPTADPKQGSYEVKFVGALPFSQNLNNLLGFSEKQYPHLAHAENAFYGLFKEARLPGVLVFTGLDTKRLSELSLSNCANRCPSVAMFEHLWEHWAITTNPFEGTQFNREPLIKVPSQSGV